MPPIELEINRQLLVDQIAPLFYSTTVVPRNHIITNIEFIDLTSTPVKVKIHTRKEQEVEVLIHNGA